MVLSYINCTNILEMNKIPSSEELTLLKDMRYKIRFVTIHLGQGGAFHDQEMQKREKNWKGKGKGKKNETILQAHYYGYLVIF